MAKIPRYYRYIELNENEVCRYLEEVCKVGKFYLVRKCF